MRGRLVTFEGGEGTGKTTQAKRLAAWLHDRGSEVVLTREPGGTEGAEAIRGLLLEGTARRWLPSTELLLVAAARDDHLQRLILPALGRGAIVICDRYLDSTRVYQGLAGGVLAETIEVLHRSVVRAPEPDLTLVLDLPAEAGLARRAAAGARTRFEAMDPAFHDSVREGFRQLADREPHRITLIDASAPEAAVTARIRATVENRIDLERP